MTEQTNQTGRVRLVVTRGANKGRTFWIEEGENLIGRWDPDAGAFPEIDLDAEDLDAKISRTHAVLERRGEQLWITDLESLNGTFVNRGPRLEPAKKQEVFPGDEIIIGKTFVTLERS